MHHMLATSLPPQKKGRAWSEAPAATAVESGALVHVAFIATVEGRSAEREI